ncbi:MAG: hypothetical protein ACYS18_12645, partial [Planctomycetota bacterium]
MNRKQHNLLPVFMAVIIVFVCLVYSTTASAKFRAAIAVRDVTPDPLLPVSGGVGPSKPSTRTFGRL